MRLEKSEGMGPERALERRERTRREERRERVSGGIGPTRPIAGRRRERTVVLVVGSQVTPTQVQREVVVGQARRGWWGTWDRNESRAARSSEKMVCVWRMRRRKRRVVESGGDIGVTGDSG